MLEDITTILGKLFPAFVGALISARWLNGTWPQKLFMIASGIGLSAVLSPWLADITNIPEYAVGALTGLFGIAIADGLYRAWNDLNLGLLLREIIRAKFGLPGKDKHD